MSSATNPPGPHEIEVSLFGPGSGYGESIVLHIGNGKWIIVDSCINPRTAAPAPLSYLKSLGINVASDVVMVVASHWHDDHIQGLGQIVEECLDARFVCPAAMAQKDFDMLKEVYAASPLKDKSGVTEFTKIHQLLLVREKAITRAVASRCLLRFDKASSHLPFDVEVNALSPSDAIVDAYIKKLLAATITAQGPRRRMPRQGPNDAAVVIQLIAGTEAVLLGSDMENSGLYGWRVVVGEPGRKDHKSHAFKVAHHGSETGHDDIIWSHLLHPGPISFLTPFRNGGVRLPKGADVARIRGLSSAVYITVPLDAAPGKRVFDRNVQKDLDMDGVDIKKAFTACGHIRFRFTPGKTTTGIGIPDLFDGAATL